MSLRSRNKFSADLFLFSGSTKPFGMAKVEEESSVGTLTVKLPAFWADKPEAWFVQAEANFRARRITSQMTKFNLVVVALDADTIDGLLDLLEKPPDEDSYDQLKARLMQSFKISTMDKIKLALELPPLADENPVRLADKIMALTREASSEDVAKTVFMLKLPDGVRKTMWAEPIASWPEMKARASCLWHAEKTKSRASVYEAANANAEAKVSKPETNAVKVMARGNGKSKFQKFAANFKQWMGGPCVFHEFFGHSATRCRSPCSQEGNVKAGRSIASIAAGSLTLHDASSNSAFLIDTGAEVSVVPATEQDRQRAPLEKELVAANGSRIPVLWREENATESRHADVPVDVPGSRRKEVPHRCGFLNAQLSLGRSAQ